jgi:hypothetical protein
MISLYSAILIVQKHFYGAKIARIRHQIPTDITLIFNRHEFPIFFLEFFV